MMTVLVAVMIMGVLIGASSNYVLSRLRSKQDALMFARISLIRQGIEAVVQNDEAWARTVSHQPELACLGTSGTNRGSCVGSTWRDLKIYTADDRLYYDPVPEQNGFKENASGMCTTFNSETGNDDCPFRFSLKWVPSCVPDSANSCIQRARIYGELQIKRTANFMFNPDRYKIDFTRGEIEFSLEANCTLLGGKFDQVNRVCKLPIQQDWSSDPCPNGTVLDGLNTSSGGLLRSCRPSGAFSQWCMGSSAANGLNPDGSPACIGI